CLYLTEGMKSLLCAPMICSSHESRRGLVDTY
uniref:Uncharacterized protein n=1 Tax=Amphimedon queenslandica TaxID=400682 RepID=A0A1X7UK15_AMPQE